MGIALTQRELINRLIKERQHYHRRPNNEAKNNSRSRLTVDDLLIIRKVGESTLDGWDLEPEADDD